MADTTPHLQRGQSQTFRAVVSRGRNDGRGVLITVTAPTAGQPPAVGPRQTGSTTSERGRGRDGSRGGFGRKRRGFSPFGGRRDESPMRTRAETARPPATSSIPNAASRKSGEDATADAAETNLLQKQGRRYFHVLDHDTSGHLDRTEWEASRRLKPIFEQAGIAVTAISEKEFVEQFVAAARHSKRQQKESEL